MQADLTLRMAGLAALGLTAVALFMTVGVPNGAWDFALAFRGSKLLALVLVAYAVAVSTVLFHTVTCNRILTPSIMGFDALYLLIQTTLVFVLGGMGSLALDPALKFGAEVLIMMGFASSLFLWLFGHGGRHIHLTLLVGIVFGVLFRSLSNFMSRLIDPADYVVLQGATFASFNSVDDRILWFSALLCLATFPVLWTMRHALDVMALGREAAINLGLPYRRMVLRLLGLITLLVSVSTALVGPVTFFGLLVAHLAYLSTNDPRHTTLLPAAVLIACTVLIGGQTLFEHVLGLQGALSIVIDFLGGLVFLTLLLRGVSR